MLATPVTENAMMLMAMVTATMMMARTLLMQKRLAMTMMTLIMNTATMTHDGEGQDDDGERTTLQANMQTENNLAKVTTSLEKNLKTTTAVRITQRS